jgi:pimeloyl-ACP methyl ester carboxylesterase
MATANINGVRLFYGLRGAGKTPIVLVHGSWDSHADWDLLVPGLAESFRVLTYDRRGHSQSGRLTGQGSIREDVADLAGLIDHLSLGPAWVVGNSFGASITLRLAGERPDLLRGVIAHEPPIFAVLANDPVLAPMLEDVGKSVDAVARRIAAGDHVGAAEQFVETVALGPGTWAQLPDHSRQTFIENAPTFLDEAKDPEQSTFDFEWIADFSRPLLLTKGGQSPPIFALVVAMLAEALPDAEVVTFPDAGHIPHVTHPNAYLEAILKFINSKTHPDRP